MSSHLIQTGRILSLDVFRGLTIALMIFVNSQGSTGVYPILEHASWNGCTLADLVFPFFLYIVGLTTVISLRRQINADKARGDIYKSILNRTVLLFLLGLFLNIFPFYLDFSSVRVYGVLQRIALCYFVCSLIYLNTSVKTQILIFLSILCGYWFIMTWVPVPGYGALSFSMESNWVGYIDTLLFSPRHLFGKLDPEGLLSTIPAIATTLSGLLTGSFLLTRLSKQKKGYLMLAMGLMFLLLGWLWGYSFPINKNLWTSSFVLWTSGYALIVFALCFFIVDHLGYIKWSLPLKILGMNALFIFVLHVLLLRMQAAFFFPLKNGVIVNLRVGITEYLFGQYSLQNANFFYALCFLLFNFLIAVFLYRRQLFFKL